jgi:hypothetical protein
MFHEKNSFIDVKILDRRRGGAEKGHPALAVCKNGCDIATHP